MDTQQQLNELKQRIEQLENPNVLSDRLVDLLVEYGFIKSDTTIQYSAGVGGNPFSVLFGRTGNESVAIEYKPQGVYIPFDTKGSTDRLYTPINLENFTGSVLVFSTGTLPTGLSATVYPVLDATTTYIRLDDGTSNPLTFSGTGTGVHYITYM